MFKIKGHLPNYRKRSAAAALIVLSLLAAGCGSGGKDEHEQHAAPQETSAAADAHSGHGGHSPANAAGNEEAAENHSGHGGMADSEDTQANVKLEWRYSPESPKPGEKTKIELFLSDAVGNPIEKYDVNHEKLMHLIVVSGDLAEFNHLHPEYAGKGKFEVEASFVKSGAYQLYADFIPSGSGQLTVTSSLEVSGAKQAAEPLKKDKALVKAVDGVSASLAVSSFKAGEETDLTFTFSDEKTKKPITDLQPYLGAIGHVVILSEDLSRYLHVHPKEGNESGPAAEFATSFPEPGLYKIWGQFQREEKTFIVPFTIEIE